MNNKKRYQKIFVNDECVVDFTEQTITAEDVAEGKIFYDTSGKLQTGTLQPKIIAAASDWYYSDGTADIDVRGRSLSRHCFFYDSVYCSDYCGSYGNSYNIYLDKDSYISSDSWYSTGTNYMWFVLYCDKDMSWDDLWNCIPFSASLEDSDGHFPSGINEIYFGNEQPTDARLPDTYCIPQYFWQLYTSFNTITVPAGVQEIHGYNNFSCDDFIFEGTEPPVINSVDAINSCNRIIVPNGSKQNYINAENWADKAEIIFEQSEVLN
jgi:hypothetical protein